MTAILAHPANEPESNVAGGHLSSVSFQCQSENRQSKTGNRYNQEDMAPQAPPHRLRWFWVPLRVLLMSFLLALLAFAVCLLLGILGLAIIAAVRGVHPNLTLAYRDIALPSAAAGGIIALVAAVAMEYRRPSKT
jgi:hypothetical protein